jgi:hypothetical protein
MNERIGNNKIYALAKEAGLIEFEQFAWNPELGSPTYESVAKARKFAEMIVRECVDLTHWQDFDMCVEQRIRLSIAQDIKEHFGVEE